MSSTAVGQRSRSATDLYESYAHVNSGSAQDATGLRAPSTQMTRNEPDVSADTRVDSNLSTVLEDKKHRALRRLRDEELPTIPDTIRVSGLDKWTGVVLSVDEDIFSAELVSTSESRPVVADFPRRLVDSEDGLHEGDVVYVTARTVKGRNGQVSTTSSIRLRRLGNWTKEDLEAHKAKAKLLKASLNDLID